MEILGHARLRVRIASSAPVAYLSAKLCDVFPDGTSSLVARGMANLTHRDSRAEPSGVEPGTGYDLDLGLEVASWTFEAGHRIRLDLAGTDWPNAWAPPEPVTLTVDRATGELILPVLDGPSPVTERPELPLPNVAEANRSPKEREKTGDESTGWVKWSVAHEQLKHETRAYAGSFGDYDAHDVVPSYSELYDGVVTVSTDDPGVARSESEARFEMRWPEATCTSHVRMSIASDAKTYRVRIDLTTSEDDQER